MCLSIGTIIEVDGVRGELVHCFGCDRCVFYGELCEDNDIECYPFANFRKVESDERV